MVIQLDIAVIIAYLTLTASVGGALWWMYKLVRRFEKVEKQAGHRKEDDEQILVALLACLDGLIETGANGPVKAAREKLNQYIIESR